MPGDDASIVITSKGLNEIIMYEQIDQNDETWCTRLSFCCPVILGYHFKRMFQRLRYISRWRPGRVKRWWLGRAFGRFDCKFKKNCQCRPLIVGLRRVLTQTDKMIIIKLPKFSERSVVGAFHNLTCDIISPSLNWGVDKHIPKDSGAY